MGELIGLFVLGLTLAIGCSFMLSSQLDRASRGAADTDPRSDDRALARLERLARRPVPATEPTLGVILEPSGANRHSPSGGRSSGAKNGS
jgi:hypothetical protein